MNPLAVVLLSFQILIGVCMGGLILIQRSEGGALGMGGGPSGFMSARGAGNLLTNLTGWLAFLFFANSIGLTIVGNMSQHAKSALDSIDTSKLILSAPASSAAAPSDAASSSAPSLNDLPLATSPTLQAPPVQTVPQPTSAAPVVRAAPPVRMPAPLSSTGVTLPATGTAKSSKSLDFTLPASSQASKPATQAPVPTSSTSQ